MSESRTNREQAIIEVLKRHCVFSGRFNPVPEEDYEALARDLAALLGQPSDDLQAVLLALFEQHGMSVGVGRIRDGGVAIRSQDVRVDAQNLGTVKALVQPSDDPVREALAELVRLKDGPRDASYRAGKDAAWEAARAALSADEAASDG